jgi:hypothetical protein
LKEEKEIMIKKGMSNIDFSRKSSDFEMTELEFEKLFYKKFN